MRNNNSPKKIIRDRSIGVFTRSKIRDNSCSIANFEPRIVKDALNNEDSINFLN